MNPVAEKIYKIGIIPVIAFNSVEEALPLCRALAAGGLPAAEVTFRTECAEECIRLIHSEMPEMLLGAGTVLTKDQARRALAAGAQFIVSPGLSVAVANICKERNIPYYPGCVTPTEIMQALELGITTVKFFPANVYGGLKAMKALAGPFPQIKFIPTGGVDRSNIDEFLAWDKIEAVGGSFYVKEALDKMNAQK